MIFSPVVTIPKPTWRRVQMLVSEIAYMQEEEEVSGLELDGLTEKFIQRIVDEYVRQYFEESTRAAATVVLKRRKAREDRLLGY